MVRDLDEAAVAELQGDGGLEGIDEADAGFGEPAWR